MYKNVHVGIKRICTIMLYNLHVGIKRNICNYKVQMYNVHVRLRRKCIIIKYNVHVGILRICTKMYILE